jgi:hypothetical protein
MSGVIVRVFAGAILLTGFAVVYMVILLAKNDRRR